MKNDPVIDCIDEERWEEDETYRANICAII